MTDARKKELRDIARLVRYRIRKAAEKEFLAKPKPKKP